MVWLNFGKSLLYTRFFLATLVRGPKDFTMFLQKVGGGLPLASAAPSWRTCSAIFSRLPRTPSPRGTPPKTPVTESLFFVIVSRRRSNPFQRLYYIFP